MRAPNIYSDNGVALCAYMRLVDAEGHMGIWWAYGDPTKGSTWKRRDANNRWRKPSGSQTSDGSAGLRLALDPVIVAVPRTAAWLPPYPAGAPPTMVETPNRVVDEFHHAAARSYRNLIEHGWHAFSRSISLFRVRFPPASATTSGRTNRIGPPRREIVRLVRRSCAGAPGGAALVEAELTGRGLYA
jgi:hypothetical protein